MPVVEESDFMALQIPLPVEQVATIYPESVSNSLIVRERCHHHQPFIHFAWSWVCAVG
jgi:hypothetical protein